MYTAAQRFMAEFSAHFQQAVKTLKNAGVNFTIISLAGNAKIKLRRVLNCLMRVNFKNQGLNMAVERYICRCTPDYAAHSEPDAETCDAIWEWVKDLYGYADADRPAFDAAIRSEPATACDPSAFHLASAI
jgi:hypothetical protein